MLQLMNRNTKYNSFDFCWDQEFSFLTTKCNNTFKSDDFTRNKSIPIQLYLRIDASECFRKSVPTKAENSVISVNVLRTNDKKQQKKMKKVTVEKIILQ